MELLSVAVSCGVGVLGTYIKMTNEVTKIKSRLYSLEKKENEVKEILKELVTSVHEIKILLAEKGIK